MDAKVTLGAVAVIIVGASLVVGLKNTLPGSLVELLGALVLAGYWLQKFLPQ